jgi:hypothetical protein
LGIEVVKGQLRSIADLGFGRCRALLGAGHAASMQMLHKQHLKSFTIGCCNALPWYQAGSVGYGRHDLLLAAGKHAPLYRTACFGSSVSDIESEGSKKRRYKHQRVVCMSCASSSSSCYPIKP